jgi:hypothetical protein
LKSLRGLRSVTFHGSPTLQAELRPLMLKPKGWEEDVVKGSKKRKASKKAEEGVQSPPSKQLKTTQTS